MSDEERSSWRLTAIAMALVVTTALVTGLVFASWTQGERPAPAGADARAAVRHSMPVAARTPAEIDVGACNAYADTAADDLAFEVDAAGVAGTRYGLDEGQSHDARYVEMYRACMKRRGFTG
jgi:hypothetical protein